VLIGAELVAGTRETDISEFTGGMHAFLERYFASRPSANLVPLNVHEYVHTQQRGIGQTVLARAIREGSADFVTELVTGRRMPLGYAIARACYERATDKQLAVREMIELPFDDEAAVDAFLDRSGYFADGADKAALLRAYEARRPVVTRVVPLSPDGTVDASTTELRIEFSAAMGPYTGMGYGAGGETQWPITSRVGFSADGRAYVVRVALKPGTTYSFVLEGSEGGGFRSADGGYPLRTDTVTFTTLGTSPEGAARSRNDSGSTAPERARLASLPGRPRRRHVH
jgi:hypothetical protein